MKRLKTRFNSETLKLHSFLPFLSPLPPTEFFKCLKTSGKERRLMTNDMYKCGWTDRKRGRKEICPAKEWNSSIQRMPANLTVTSYRTTGLRSWASGALPTLRPSAELHTSRPRIRNTLSKFSSSRTYSITVRTPGVTESGLKCQKHASESPTETASLSNAPLVSTQLFETLSAAPRTSR